MCKSSEKIPLQTVAKILGIYPQGVRQLMDSGKLDIGIVISNGRKDGRKTYRVYRSKLAKFLDKPADFHWPEEDE